MVSFLHAVRAIHDVDGQRSGWRAHLPGQPPPASPSAAGGVQPPLYEAAPGGDGPPTAVGEAPEWVLSSEQLVAVWDVAALGEGSGFYHSVAALALEHGVTVGDLCDMAAAQAVMQADGVGALGGGIGGLGGGNDADAPLEGASGSEGGGGGSAGAPGGAGARAAGSRSAAGAVQQHPGEDGEDEDDEWWVQQAQENGEAADDSGEE